MHECPNKHFDKNQDLPPQRIQKIIYWIHKRFNIKMGVIAGICTGTVVCYINLKYGMYIALAAFSRQFFYNLVMAGYNTKLCERCAVLIQNRWPALFCAAFLPSFVAFSGIFSVHYFLGTPDPLESTLWQGYANLFVFFLTALVFRDDLDKRYKLLKVLLSPPRSVRRDA
ncbi:MAG: hypothetical protein R6U66_08650 [Bacteroidales bacterium]